MVKKLIGTYVLKTNKLIDPKHTYIAPKYNINLESYLIFQKEIARSKTYCHFVSRLVLTKYLTFDIPRILRMSIRNTRINRPLIHTYFLKTQNQLRIIADSCKTNS